MREARGEGPAEAPGQQGAGRRAEAARRDESGTGYEAGPAGLDQQSDDAASQIDFETIQEHARADQAEQAPMERADRQSVEPRARGDNGFHGEASLLLSSFFTTLARPPRPNCGCRFSRKAATPSR